MLLNPFRPCEGSPTFQEEYRGSYVPQFIETEYGLQVVAPDTPYVAAAGPNQLYFIDTRFDTETARHIKEQIERASVPNMDEYISIDELSATAEVKNLVTGETTFVFDPPYARVLFARGMNKRNPDLKLPQHETAGDWLVTYDRSTTLAKSSAPITNAAGICHIVCMKAADKPKEEGETDASYYQRMDKLHWE
ncbi:hypothetical protein BGW36DRAFT_296859 [Talaromyces proteolyticus]|uniref:Uncharacterized protein n=1 Tax=Talaromyces proteolyticus TaxID=1131652 RepID=A0AAD4KPV2_9EURO|nr:uncharacterized protein BGW36DRAFT_296859 [Talaromyces proteolyticus]KAH8696481.1 hypothetical protein BGW36DRAFT_296859 [Talaromyces proteolyticus]